VAPRPAAPGPGGLGTVGRVITGLVQVACLAAAVVVVAAGLTAGIFALLSAVFGAERPVTLTANQARGSWLASTACRPPTWAAWP